MAKLDSFKEVVNEFADIADFLMIYVKEAHAVDGWNLRGWKYEDLYQHKSLEDRINAALLLKKEDLPCPLVVDLMDNNASLSYGAIPERLYIIFEGKTVLANGLGPDNYSVDDVKSWLNSFRSNRASTNRKMN